MKWQEKWYICRYCISCLLMSAWQNLRNGTFQMTKSATWMTAHYFLNVVHRDIYRLALIYFGVDMASYRGVVMCCATPVSFMFFPMGFGLCSLRCLRWDVFWWFRKEFSEMYQMLTQLYVGYGWAKKVAFVQVRICEYLQTYHHKKSLIGET